MKPPLPHNEAARLEVLRQLSLLDTPPEQEYDDLTHLAAFLCRGPMASITLIDEDRQWFKAKVGLQDSETARNISFCAHAILGSDLFIVPDATQDERFRDNPLVLGDPHIRFYAGMPLNTAEGATIGTLCVIDREPRDLPESSCLALRVLGRQVVAHIQIRRQLSQLQQVSAERLKIERRLRISQNKLRNANLKLRELASTDALTGLRNRRAFELRLRHEWKLSTRLKAPLSMLLLDLDHFKCVNDIGGHSAGDQVLKHVASVLMTSVRETDLVARYGGEEFAILLPATSHENALKVAEHVRRAISAHPCDGLRISASIGVASGVGSILDPDFGPECCPLVAQADAALYAAKGAGRNQVASAEGPSRLLADELLR